MHRAGLGGGRGDGMRRRRPGGAAGRRRAGARSRPSLRRRQSRDQGARRRAGWPTCRRGACVEGMAMLDEAMALACGPVDNGEVAAKSACSFFTACYVSGDFERVGSWTDLLARRGVMSESARRGRRSCRATATASGRRCWSRWADGVKPRRCSLPPGRNFERDVPGAELAPRHRARRAAHPAGPAGRGRAAADRQGPVDLGLAAQRSAASRPRRPSPSPGPRPDAGCGRSATTGCGRSNCSSCWSRPSWRRATSRRPERRALRSRSAPARSTSPRCAPDRHGAQARTVAARRRRCRARSPCSSRPSTSSIRAGSAWLHASLLIDLARLRELAGDAAGASLDAQAAAAALARLDVVVDADSAQLRRPAHPPTVGDGRRAASPCCRATASGGRPTTTGDAGAPARTPRASRYLAELDRQRRRRAPRARPRRPRRGRRPRRARSAGARRRRRAARQPAPAPPTGAGSRSCGRRPTEALEAGMLERAEAAAGRARPARRPAGGGVRAGRPRPARRVGGRAGPAQRHPCRAGGDRQARPRRCPRPARRSIGASGPGCTARTSRSTASCRWIVQSLTERIRTAIERHRGMEPIQPTIDEIADGIYRISTWVPDVSPDGFTFNQFLVIGRRAAAVPHRPARHVPAGRRGGGQGRAGRVAALDHASATSRPTSAAR